MTFSALAKQTPRINIKITSMYDDSKEVNERKWQSNFTRMKMGKEEYGKKRSRNLYPLTVQSNTVSAEYSKSPIVVKNLKEKRSPKGF